MEAHDWIGTVGVSLLLLAFALNLSGRWSRLDKSYQWTNLAGAGLACYAAYLIRFVPFVVLEGTWALVAAVALARRTGD